MKYSSVPTPLSKFQLKRLFNHSDTLTKMFITIAISTGMRRAEIVNLKLNWLDLKSNTIIHPNTKNGKMRRYEIPIELSKILKKWVLYVRSLYPDTEWLFPNGWKPEEHIKKEHYHKLFSKAREKAGLDMVTPFSDKNYCKYTIHSLRDTFCCILLANGVDIYEIKDLMGHSKVSITERYYAYLPNKNKTETINTIFNSKTSPELNKRDPEVEKEFEGVEVDPIKELQMRLVNDEIGEEEYKRKLNLIGGFVADEEKNSYFG